jgi:hypothetical protein
VEEWAYDSMSYQINSMYAAVTGDLSLSLNTWRSGSRVFEVTSYHDGWCYELYEVSSTNIAIDYIYVRLPDLQPAGGPFAPASARQVTVAGHGSPRLPRGRSGCLTSGSASVDGATVSGGRFSGAPIFCAPWGSGGAG